MDSAVSVFLLLLLLFFFWDFVVAEELVIFLCLSIPAFKVFDVWAAAY
jgi:hypothetical protein